MSRHPLEVFGWLGVTVSCMELYAEFCVFCVYVIGEECISC